MIKMISAVTGVEIWVADDRVEAYLKRGNKLAEPESKPEKPKKRKTVKKKG